MLWASAFCAAKRVEAEGVAAFESGIVMKGGSRKGKRSLDDAATERGEEEDDEGGGCFRQPAGLSAFYKRLKSEAEPGGWPPLPGAGSSSSGVGPDGARSEAPERRDNLALQICRAWLKRHYLGLGQECDGLKCGRSHKAPQNIGKMYTDYSFKGLSKENRAKIITKMEEEKETLSGSNGSAGSENEQLLVFPSKEPENENEEGKEEDKPTEMGKKDKKDKKDKKKEKKEKKKDKKKD